MKFEEDLYCPNGFHPTKNDLIRALTECNKFNENRVILSTKVNYSTDVAINTPISLNAAKKEDLLGIHFFLLKLSEMWHC